MKKVVCLLLVSALLIGCFSFPVSSSENIYKEFYVDGATGDDLNSGTRVAPFKTIQKAQEAVRAVNDNMTGDIVVNIMPGTYHLDKTETFTSENSGKNGCSIIYRGADPENPPVFSGGREIKGWKPYRDGIYKAELLDMTEVRNLYINGFAATRARTEWKFKYIEDYNLTQYDQMVVKGKFKYKAKGKGQKAKEESQKTEDESQKAVESSLVYVPYKITDAEVVGKLPDERYIRENNGVKFIYAKKGENVYELAKILGVDDYQIIKYNNLGKRKVLKDDEIIYVEPKKNKAMRRYKYHTIQKGETLSHVSRLYAVKLKSIFKMNDMDENTILHVGDNIRLR